jgi:hypothetical protein
MNSGKHLDPVVTEDSKVVVTTDCAPVVSCMNPNTLFTLPWEIVIHAMPEARIDNNDTITVMHNLFYTCRHFHSFLKEPLTDRMLIALRQAVIDEDYVLVKKILNARLELLLIDLPKDFVIESQCTWQRMYAENPLVMAAKRRQIKMMGLLLVYYGKLPQTDAVMNARAKGLSAWVHYEIFENNRGQYEIVIPDKYAKDMLDVFCEETFPNGVPDYSKIPTNVRLSETTEKTLESLFNDLLPECAVRLDDYFDVELLLFAVYKTYCDHLRQFQNWNQRDAFCVRVIGLIQGVQSPETAKIFCEFFGYVKNRNACEHELIGGKAYYRIGRDSFIGLGFNFLSDVCCGRARAEAPKIIRTWWQTWGNHIKQKQEIFERYAARWRLPYRDLPGHRQAGGVIS